MSTCWCTRAVRRATRSSLRWSEESLMAVRLGDRLRSVVGGATAKKLGEHLDLHSVEDLLRHYPRRYVRRGELTALSRLVPGEHVTVQAEVVQATNKTF